MDRKSQWKPVFATLSGKQGFIAVSALLIMVILLMFGVTFLTMATTENTMVTNGINGQVAFNITEAGIDHAKRALLGANLTTVIQNNQTNPFLNQVSFAGGTYTVNVTNNCSAADIRCTNIAVPGATLDTGGPTNDTDLRVVVESTGTSTKNGVTATKVIRALVEIPAILDPPSSIYTLNGPDGTRPADFTFDGNSFLVQGQDTLPGQTTPISPVVDPVPGLGVMPCPTCSNPNDVPLQESLSSLGPQQPDNITGAGADPSIQEPSTLITASYLTSLKSYLTAPANASLTCTGNTSFSDNTPPGNCTGSSSLGTQTNPQITVVNGDLQFKGSASGFGILLVTGDFEMEGTATFQGIILVDGDGAKVELKGDNKVWGSIIQINRTSRHSGETGLEIKGNAQVYYSRQAIKDYGGGSLNSTTLAWSERT